MATHHYVQTERTFLKRGVTDFERKLKAAAASGLLAYAVVLILRAFHITLPTEVAELIPLVIAIAGGYTVHSAAPFTDATGVTAVTAKSEPKALTGAIPLPVPSTPAYPTPNSVADLNPAPAASFTEVVQPASVTETTAPGTADTAEPTQVYSPGDAFWKAHADAKPKTATSEPDGWGN